MITHKIDCFIVEESYDRDSKVICYTSSEAVAQSICEDQKFYRTYRKFDKQYLIVESKDEMQDLKKAKLKEVALAKLTPAEKAALGF